MSVLKPTTNTQSTPGGGAVDSVFGRIGVVVGQANDYAANQITNFPNTPFGSIASTNTQDAVNFLDTQNLNSAIKQNVDYYADAAIATYTYDNGGPVVEASITGTVFNVPLIVDGVTLAVNDTFLFPTGVADSDNGSYKVIQVANIAQPFKATRMINFNSAANIVQNSVFGISKGTYAGQQFKLDEVTVPVTVGTTPLTFSAYAVGGTYAFEALTFTTSNTLITPPRVTITTPIPQQIDGQLIGGYGVWLEQLSFVGTAPIDLELTNLVGVTRINNTPAMSALGSGVLSFPALKSVYDNGFFAANATITSLLMPLLEIISGASTTTLTYAAVTTLNFASLRSIQATTLSGNTLLTNFALPVIEYIYGTLTSTSGNAALTNFTLGTSLKYFNANINFTSCALNQASVDGVLAALVALDGTGGKNLYGTSRIVTITGTSSTPSATGLLDKATLVGRGVTVTTN